MTGWGQRVGDGGRESKLDKRDGGQIKLQDGTGTDDGSGTEVENRSWTRGTEVKLNCKTGQGWTRGTEVKLNCKTGQGWTRGTEVKLDCKTGQGWLH